MSVYHSQNTTPHYVTHHITQGWDPIQIKIYAADVHVPQCDNCILSTLNCNYIYTILMPYTVQKYGQKSSGL